jgi:hypothetical protein
MEIELSKGTKLRLNRIKELKNYTTDYQALEYAVSTCWLVLEQRETRRKVEGK